jgi:SSS family solute:Na+ symporter
MVLPPLAYGIFITGLLSTIMSTIDSLGLISAITFGRDIIWRIQTPANSDQKPWTNASNGLVRKGLVVTALIALGLAFSIPSVVKLWYVLGSIIVPGLVLPFFLSFSAKKLSGPDIVIMMVLPVLVSVIWTISGNILDSYPLNLEPFYPGILTSGLIYGLKVTRGKRN